MAVFSRRKHDECGCTWQEAQRKLREQALKSMLLRKQHLVNRDKPASSALPAPSASTSISTSMATGVGSASQGRAGARGAGREFPGDEALKNMDKDEVGEVLKKLKHQLQPLRRLRCFLFGEERVRGVLGMPWDALGCSVDTGATMCSLDKLSGLFWKGNPICEGLLCKRDLTI